MNTGYPGEEDEVDKWKRIRAVAVYCGSKTPENPVYAEGAARLGRFLAEHEMTLVFGGSNVGTMKILADAVLENGGRAVGVFPANFPRTLLHPGLTESVIAADLAERKRLMLERADACVALPGSFGTWDELFDALALRKIKSGHRKPVGVLNIDGYFDALLTFIRHSVETGFTAQRHAGLLKAAATPERLFKQLAGSLVGSGSGTAREKGNEVEEQNSGEV